MGWKEQLEEAKKRKAAAALSADDLAEVVGREEAAREMAEAIEAENKKAQLDLDRRVDAAREGGKPVRGVLIKGTGHSFVVSDPGALAYNAWEKGVSASVIATVTGDSKTDRPTVSREFAVSAVIDWNGIKDFGPSTENGHNLREFFKAHPAIVQEVVNAAVEVAKEAASTRKSGA